MIHFRIVKNKVHPEREAVEIVSGGKLLGVLYPNKDGDGVVFVSMHMKDVEVDDELLDRVLTDPGEHLSPPVPSVRIQLKRIPCILSNGGQVMLSEKTL